MQAAKSAGQLWPGIPRRRCFVRADDTFRFHFPGIEERNESRSKRPAKETSNEQQTPEPQARKWLKEINRELSVGKNEKPGLVSFNSEQHDG